MAKEDRETEREKLPHTPIREKGSETEERSHHITRACARGNLPPVIDVHTPPDWELFHNYALSMGYTDETYLKAWFKMMCDEYFWLCPNTGDPVRHWPAFFRRSYLNDHPGDKKDLAPKKSFGFRKSTIHGHTANNNVTCDDHRNLF